MRIDRTILHTFICFIFLSVTINAFAIDDDVRLQDNGWLRIISQFVEEQTPEEFFKKEKDDPRLGLFKGEMFRTLHIKIQFLKPCKATTRDEEWKKRNPDVFDSADEEAIMIVTKGLMGRLQQEGKKKEAEEVAVDMAKRYPNFLDDYILPHFRCDYRIKVFATFYSSKGYEIETQGKIPNALLINVNEFSEEWKTEMLLGETTDVPFIIPDDATTWKVWVPR